MIKYNNFFQFWHKDYSKDRDFLWISDHLYIIKEKYSFRFSKILLKPRWDLSIIVFILA